MNQLSYFSVTAFLAHYQALDNAASGRGATSPLSALDRETLSAMSSVLQALTPEERSLLLDDGPARQRRECSGEERRRRERTEHKLHRLLSQSGIVRS